MKARSRFQRLGDEIDVAGGGANVGFDDAAGRIDDGAAVFRILQQLLDGAAKAGGDRDLDAGAVRVAEVRKSLGSSVVVPGFAPQFPT